jgi:hypothetical protein
MSYIFLEALLHATFNERQSVYELLSVWLIYTASELLSNADSLLDTLEWHQYLSHLINSRVCHVCITVLEKLKRTSLTWLPVA